MNDRMVAHNVADVPLDPLIFSIKDNNVKGSTEK